MKTKIFLFGMVLIGFLGFSQTATTTLSLPNLKNEFKIKFDKNVNDDIDVQITDSENSAVIIPLSLKSDDPISKVVAEIYKKIGETTTNYSFKIGKPAGDVVLKITVVPGTASTHTDFLNAIAALPEADFIKLVKPKTLFNNDTPPTTYSNYLLSKIPNSGNEIVVFDGSVTIKFKRDAAGIVNLEDAGTLKISDVQGEAAFYTSFFTTYHMDTTTIGSFMFTTTNFAAVKTIDFNTNVNTNKLEETYKAVAGKSDFDFVNNYDIKNTLTATTASHTVSIKTNLKDHNFILKFCDEAHNCNSTSAIGFSDERSKFIKKVGDWLKTINTNYTMEEADLAELFGKIKTYNETKNSDENTKKTTATLKSIADQLDNAEKRYAGIISIEKRVPVYRNKDWDWNYKAVKDTMFVLKDTANCIVFFNNKIKLIQIEGSLTSNPDKNFVTSNLQYSVPLRAMNTSTHYIPISPNDSDAYGFYININDLLTYSKNVKTTSNSIKNADYSIEPGKPKRVEQRRLMDFFTGILFSDVLGVNSDKPNNLVIAEGRIKMPIWLRNYGYSSFLNFLNADFNVPLSAAIIKSEGCTTWSPRSILTVCPGLTMALKPRWMRHAMVHSSSAAKVKFRFPCGDK